jgi:hypothetical protein
LEHDGTHHFIVLVPQKVAVVEEARIFSQLVDWYIEICISFVVLIVGRLSPSDSHHIDLKCFNQSGIFPSSVVLLRWRSDIIFDVFIYVSWFKCNTKCLK